VNGFSTLIAGPPRGLRAPALGIALSGPDLIVRALARQPRDAQALAADLEIHSSIPLKRGLGSSAAAAVAGALLADQLLSGAVGIDRVQQVAVELDGHPDNVVPCLRAAAGRVMWCEFPIKLPLRGAIFIPDEELATSAARAVLPQQVPLADAVFNLGRTALFVAALGQGRIELLGEAMEDRLHQTPRAGLLPWLPELLREARAAGAAGAALSGAGTTVFALCAPESARAVCARMMEVAAALGVGGRADVVEVAVPGAHVLGSG
jgi:homoserine kinase